MLSNSKDKRKSKVLFQSTAFTQNLNVIPLKITKVILSKMDGVKVKRKSGVPNFQVKKK